MLVCRSITFSKSSTNQEKKVHPCAHQELLQVWSVTHQHWPPHDQVHGDCQGCRTAAPATLLLPLSLLPPPHQYLLFKKILQIIHTYIRVGKTLGYETESSLGRSDEHLLFKYWHVIGHCCYAGCRAEIENKYKSLNSAKRG